MTYEEKKAKISAIENILQTMRRDEIVDLVNELEEREYINSTKLLEYLSVDRADIDSAMEERTAELMEDRFYDLPVDFLMRKYRELQIEMDGR